MSGLQIEGSDAIEEGDEEEDGEVSLQQLCADMLRPDLMLRLSFMALQHKDKINRLGLLSNQPFEA